MARFSNPFIQILTGNGKPIPGAKLYFYEPGTTTLKDTYSDSALSVANTNPIIADGSGRFGDIFLSGTYATALKDADDVTIDTADPIGGVSDGAFSLWVNDNTYNVPDIVVGSDNLFYKAITNSNQGNDPTSSPTTWQVIYFIDNDGSTILYDADIGVNVQAYDADLDTVATNGMGIGANQIIQLDASAKLPAVDGSLLTSVLGHSSQSLASNGYIKLNGGLVVQWGRTPASTTSTTFPIAFPTACFRIIRSPNGNTSAVYASQYSTSSISTTGFSIYASNPYPFDWIAIGH